MMVKAVVFLRVMEFKVSKLKTKSIIGIQKLMQVILSYKNKNKAIKMMIKLRKLAHQMKLYHKIKIKI